MSSALPLTLVWILTAAGPLPAGESRGEVAADQVRRFRLEYGATLQQLPPGKDVHVWLPVPRDNEYQRIREVSRTLPAEAREGIEEKYGNRMLHFRLRAPDSREVAFQMVWDVERKEVKGLAQAAAEALTEPDRKKFLSPDRRVPVDDPRPLSLLSGPLPTEKLDLARVLYDKVDGHVKYDKSQPGYGEGDVLWVCDSRFGNCTDFHSLFISLARSKSLPAYFAIGLPLPPNKSEGEIAGYHCWAFFHEQDHGWVPVDISEADKFPSLKDYYFGNLTPDRVMFTIGRDLDLVPRQEGEPLNYFVYPYVEVDGKPHTAMERKFRFQDRK